MEQTWYKAETSYTSKITPVKVSKETAAQITIISEWIGKPTVRRVAKVGVYECYFSTWEEAWSHLMQEAAHKVQMARQGLERANSQYGNVKGMRNPTLPPEAEEDCPLGPACDLSGEGHCTACERRR